MAGIFLVQAAPSEIHSEDLNFNFVLTLILTHCLLNLKGKLGLFSKIMLQYFNYDFNWHA